MRKALFLLIYVVFRLEMVSLLRQFSMATREPLPTKKVSSIRLSSLLCLRLQNGAKITLVRF
jgi:hypothetical protein